MNRTAISLAALALAAAPVIEAQVATSPRARRIADEVRHLASDALEGRKTCTPGNDSAARWLADRFRSIGLAPGGDGGTYLQNWTTGNTTATRASGNAGCRTANVVGVLRGSGRFASQAVVVGAHFDHLGTGRFGSLAADSGQIHNGADDNASGTAAVLEIARVLAADRAARGRNARTVVFVLFSGEEEGTLGSAYYGDNPVVPMDSTIAMLNYDMVGRMRSDRVLALGARSAIEWTALLDSVNATAAPLDLRASGDGWGPSDHQSFYARRRPVLHFFTDTHADYHRPSDDAEHINADGIARIADLSATLTRRLMTRAGALTFVDVPPPPPPVAAGGRGRPSLGTIPDMTDEPGGVRLSGVRAGSPADSAGMREGDILVGLGQHDIASLQDFQNALMAYEAGDRVEIRFRRGDRLIRTMVTLGGR